jgi:hypothetical protein
MPMDFKFFMAVMIFATAPILAVAQSDDTKNHAPKPTMEDVQKLVQAISSDKAKLQAYCDMDKLQDQMEKAEEEDDSKAIDELLAKADTLEQKLGPDFARITEGLDRIDLGSSEAKRFAAVFDGLRDKCK